MEIPRKVLDTLADGAEGIAVALGGGKLLIARKVLGKLPNARAAGMATTGLAVIGKLAGQHLKEANAQARERRDYLAATLTQFKLDLEQGVADKLLIRSTK